MATLDRLAPPHSASPLPQVRASWSPRRAIAVAVTLATAIAVFQVFQSSGIANTGEHMHQLETERADSSARVKNLEAEVAALSSLDRIDRAARDRLGMVPARNISYVNVAVPAPSGPLLPRPVAAKPTPEVSRPFWERVLKAMPVF